MIRLDHEPHAGLRAGHGWQAGRARLPGEPVDLLPSAPGPPVGREVELSRARNWVRRARLPDQPAPVVLVDGPIGSGRATFARALAGELAGGLGGPRLWVRLGGEGRRRDPAEQLTRWLRLLGPAGGARVGDAAGGERLRDHPAAADALVVVEEVIDAAEVELLRPPPGGVMIITGRGPLPAAGVANSRRVELRPLGMLDALKLLSERSGWGRLASEPAASRAILRCCGQLPLALAVAGAAMAGPRGRVPVSEFARRLVEETDRAGGDGLHAVLTLADRSLTRRQAQALRALGLLDLPTVEPDALAAMLYAERSAVGDRLEELAEAGLLDADAQPYAVHDLVRRFARGLALRVGTVRQRRAVLLRAVTTYRQKADAAVAELAVDQPVGEDRAVTPRVAARRWAEREQINLLRLLEQVAAGGGDARGAGGADRSGGGGDDDEGLGELLAGAARLAASLDRLLVTLGGGRDLELARALGLAAAERAGEARLEAWLAHRLGTWHADADRPEDAVVYLMRAVGVADAAGDAGLANVARFDLAYSLCKLQRFEEAQPLLEVLVATGVQDPELDDLVRANLGYVYRHRGRFEEARGLLEASLRNARRRRDARLASFAERNLAKLERHDPPTPTAQGGVGALTGPMPLVEDPARASARPAEAPPPEAAPSEADPATAEPEGHRVPWESLVALTSALDRLHRETVVASGSEEGGEPVARASLQRLGAALTEIRPVIGRLAAALATLEPQAPAARGRWRRVRALRKVLTGLEPHVDRLGEALAETTRTETPSQAARSGLAAASEALRVKLDELRVALRALQTGDEMADTDPAPPDPAQTGRVGPAGPPARPPGTGAAGSAWTGVTPAPGVPPPERGRSSVGRPYSGARDPQR